jgi:hypothetical protein
MMDVTENAFLKPEKTKKRENVNEDTKNKNT